jgi:hypothetical protein
MPFPISPIDGQTYANSQGTIWQYASGDASWTKVYGPDSTLYKIASGDFTIEKNSTYYVNTVNGVVDAVLPQTSISNDKFSIIDYSSNFDTNGCTIVSSGAKIFGAVADYAVSGANSYVTGFYINSDIGWHITGQQKI